MHLEQTVYNHLYMRYIGGLPMDKKTDPIYIMGEIQNAYYYYKDVLARQLDLQNFPSFSKFFKQLWCHTPLKQFIPDLEDALNQFSNHTKSIPVAGCILLSKDLSQVVLVEDACSHKWSFPRGKRNQGENDLETAIRETYEETGYHVEDLIDKNEYIVHKNPKKTTLYIISGIPLHTSFKSTDKKEITRCKFFPLNHLPQTFHVESFLNDILKYKKRKLSKWNTSKSSESIDSHEYTGCEDSINEITSSECIHSDSSSEDGIYSIEKNDLTSDSSIFSLPTFQFDMDSILNILHH